MATTICKNCDLEFKGKFCPACGQKAKTGRITLRHVLQETRQHFIHFDQGFLYTIKELLLRPGHTIRAYLEGRRVQHIKPLKFMFWTLTISFLVFHYAGLDQQMVQQLEQQADLPQGKLLAQKLVVLLTDHPATLVFLMIPCIALCSWWLFRRQPYNYAEHFILSTYLMGELSLMSVITTPIARFTDHTQALSSMMVIPSLIIWAVYYAWAYGQFFQLRRAGIYIKGILAIMIGYLFMILFTGLLVSIALIFFQQQLDMWLR